MIKPLNFQAIWFGGPSGENYLKIKKRLERVGIDVLEQHECESRKTKITSVRKEINLILINIDMISHGVSQRAREIASKQNIPWVYSSFDTTTIFSNMEKKNLLPSGVTSDSLLAILNGQETESEDPHQAIKEKIAKMFVKGVDCSNLYSFLKPEIENNKTGILSYLSSKIHDDADKYLHLMGRDRYNLFSWSKTQNLSYFNAANIIFQLAADGFLVREPPYDNPVTRGSISIHFRRIFDEASEPIQTVEESVVNPEPELVPAIEPEPKQPEAIEPQKEEEIVAQPEKKDPPKAKNNIKAAAQMLVDAIKEEHPDWTHVAIDLSTRKLSFKRIVEETIDMQA